MTAKTNQLLEAALKLPEKERLEMIERLYDSLPADTGNSVKSAWDKEITRRLEEIDDGNIQMIPLDQFRREIAEGCNGTAS